MEYIILIKNMTIIMGNFMDSYVFYDEIMFNYFKMRNDSVNF